MSSFDSESPEGHTNNSATLAEDINGLFASAYTLRDYVPDSTASFLFKLATDEENGFERLHVYNWKTKDILKIVHPIADNTGFENASRFPAQSEGRDLRYLISGKSMTGLVINFLNDAGEQVPSARRMKYEVFADGLLAYWKLSGGETTHMAVVNGFAGAELNAVLENRLRFMMPFEEASLLSDEVMMREFPEL